MLDVTANDVANVNTIGYKSSRTTFKDSLSQLQRGGTAASPTQGGANPAQVGLGVQLASIDNVMSSGSFQTTGNVLDLAIQNEGFFVLNSAESGGGVPQYTRAGNFSTNSENRLVTQDGYFVMAYPSNGATPPAANTTAARISISIPANASNLAVGPDGGVSYLDATTGQRVTAGFLALAKFANPAGLERVSGNRWLASESAGTVSPGAPNSNGLGTIISGVVEMSNVDLSQSFTQMITAQRGFQANSRVISSADEMLQDLVNLKR
jgi:flagellar hook protein FlgE